MKVNRSLWYATAVVLLLMPAVSAQAEILPARETPIPSTTSGVPHVQIGVHPVPRLSTELLNRVAAIPGIEIRNTVISLPGAKGFWVSENIRLTRPEVIVGGREFAHLHPDGSLHASISEALADQAINAGWAVSHPWADQRPGWEGFVMIFTPTNLDELEVVFDLVAASFTYVTGRGL